MRQGFPTAARGMRIGLLGGSFDPAHEGHAHLTREALKRFGLDRVWWLVSPGNPLKAEGPAPMPMRMAAARRVIVDPRVEITDLETQLGTRFTAQTLRRLMAMYPGVTFVWLMGADNLVGFHRWDRWRWILANVAVGVIARPGSGIAARRSKAALRFGRASLAASAARMLASHPPPAWCFVNVPLCSVSSSDLRRRGHWPASPGPRHPPPG